MEQYTSMDDASMVAVRKSLLAKLVDNITNSKFVDTDNKQVDYNRMSSYLGYSNFSDVDSFLARHPDYALRNYAMLDLASLAGILHKKVKVAGALYIQQVYSLSGYSFVPAGASNYDVYIDRDSLMNAGKGCISTVLNKYHIDDHVVCDDVEMSAYERVAMVLANSYVDFHSAVDTGNFNPDFVPLKGEAGYDSDLRTTLWELTKADANTTKTVRLFTPSLTDAELDKVMEFKANNLSSYINFAVLKRVSSEYLYQVFSYVLHCLWNLIHAHFQTVSIYRARTYSDEQLNKFIQDFRAVNYRIEDLKELVFKVRNPKDAEVTKGKFVDAIRAMVNENYCNIGNYIVAILAQVILK